MRPACWAESMAAMVAPPRFRVRRAKGVHLVVPVDRLPTGRTAFVLPETDDGRLAFVVPWQGVVLGGHDRHRVGRRPGRSTDEVGDVAYLLDHASRYPAGRRCAERTCSASMPAFGRS